ARGRQRHGAAGPGRGLRRGAQRRRRRGGAGRPRGTAPARPRPAAAAGERCEARRAVGRRPARTRLRGDPPRGLRDDAGAGAAGSRGHGAAGGNPARRPVLLRRDRARFRDPDAGGRARLPAGGCRRPGYRAPGWRGIRASAVASHPCRGPAHSGRDARAAAMNEPSALPPPADPARPPPESPAPAPPSWQRLAVLVPALYVLGFVILAGAIIWLWRNPA